MYNLGKKRISIIFLLFILTGFFCLWGNVSAQNAPSTPNNTTPTPTDSDFGLNYVKNKGLIEQEPATVVGNIIQWILGLLGVVLLVMIIYGGVLYMTAAGNEQKAETAKKVLTYAVIGIAIIALAFALTRYIIQALYSK